MQLTRDAKIFSKPYFSPAAIYIFSNLCRIHAFHVGEFVWHDEVCENTSTDHKISSSRLKKKMKIQASVPIHWVSIDDIGQKQSAIGGVASYIF